MAKSEDKSSPSAAAGAAPRTDPKLLEILVCPLTKTRLEYDAEKQLLISRAAGLAYPIVNGVPLMISDAAQPLAEEKPGSK